MTIYHGISLILLAFCVLIVGLIKPKWILFWVEKPDRLMISGIGIVIFMIGAVVFGEGNKEKQLALQKQTAVNTVVKTEKSTSDSSTPKPEPKADVPTAPAQAPTTSANDLRP